jgi:hypothetical protein
MATVSLQIKTNSGEAFSLGSSPHKCLQNALNLLKGIQAGAVVGSVHASTSTSDPVAASGTITLVSVSADDTVTIGKTTLTAKASPSGEDQWSQAGTDTVDAAGLVTKINAHSVLGKLVVATSSAGVVTVTSLSKASLANHIALSSSNGTRLAVTGTGYLTGGTGGAETTVASYTR